LRTPCADYGLVKIAFVGKKVRMLHHLKAAWTLMAAYPWVMLVVFLLPSFVLYRMAQRPGMVARRHFLFGSMAGLMIVFYAGACLAYLSSSILLDQIEPNTLSVSWYFWKGEPLYHDMIQPQRYSLLYGPYLYIFTGMSQGLLGPSLFSSKLPPAIAALSSLLFMFLAVRRKSNSRLALYLSALQAAILLDLFTITAFWVRSDPFILMMVTLGLFAATLNGIAGPVLLGLSLGIAVNLKVHSFIYFLPALFLALRQKWSFPGIIAGAAATAAAAVFPFVAFHNISLVNYAALLKMAVGHGIVLDFVFWNIKSFLMPVLPCALLAAYWSLVAGKTGLRGFAREHGYFIVLLLTFLLLLAPASKNGSGPTHLMPLVPSLLFMGVRLAEPGPWQGRAPGKAGGILLTVAIAWVAACFLGGLTLGWYKVWKASREGAAEASSYINDVKTIVRDHPGNIVLAGTATNDSYPGTFSRYELVFEGMPVGIDPCALMDSKQAGFGEIDLPSFNSYLEKKYGRPAIWIIPKNSTPFSMPDWYAFCLLSNASFIPLYSRTFAGDFSKMYARTASSEYYDIYTPVDGK
jgi:hypothetical protein